MVRVFEDEALKGSVVASFVIFWSRKKRDSAVFDGEMADSVPFHTSCRP